MLRKKLKAKIMAGVLALAVAVTSFAGGPVNTSAATTEPADTVYNTSGQNIVKSGTTTYGIAYTIYDSGLCVLSGTMTDDSDYNSSGEWNDINFVKYVYADFDAAGCKLKRLYLNCSNLKGIRFGSNFSSSGVTDMTQMFEGCSGLTSLDLESLDTSSVSKMVGMFWNCSGLTSINVGSFNTSNVTEMNDMFNGCRALKTVNVSGFDTSNVTDFSSMFNNCTALKTIDVSHFDTANAVRLNSMFSGCKSLTAVDLSGFRTAKAVDHMQSMFFNCSSLKKVWIPSAMSPISESIEFGDSVHIYTDAVSKPAGWHAPEGSNIFTKRTSYSSENPVKPSGGSENNPTEPAITTTTTTTSTDKDGNKVTETVEKDQNGNTVSTSTTTTLPDGSTHTDMSAARPDGSQVTGTVDKKPDGSIVSSTTTTTRPGGATTTDKVANIQDGSGASATATVDRNADGDIIKVVAGLVVKAQGKETPNGVILKLSKATVKKLYELAENRNVTLTIQARNKQKKTIVTVYTPLFQLKKGTKLEMMRYVTGTASKNKTTTITTAKIGSVGDGGTVTLSGMTPKYAYKLLKKDAFTSRRDAIYKSARLTKTSATIKKGKSTTIALAKSFEKLNLKKITYITSNKKVVTVSKTGKITGKNKGTATVSMKLTFRNGYTKTLKMKVKVR